MKKLIYRPIDLFKKPIAFLVMALLLDQYSFAQTSDIKTDSIQKKESLKSWIHLLFNNLPVILLHLEIFPGLTVQAERQVPLHLIQNILQGTSHSISITHILTTILLIIQSLVPPHWQKQRTATFIHGSGRRYSR